MEVRVSFQIQFLAVNYTIILCLTNFGCLLFWLRFYVGINENVAGTSDNNVREMNTYVNSLKLHQQKVSGRYLP